MNKYTMIPWAVIFLGASLIFLGFASTWAKDRTPVVEAAVSSLEAVTNSTTDATVTINITSNVAIQTTANIASRDLTGQDKFDGVALAAQMTEVLQVLADTIQPLADLPDDDPDKTTDPGLNCIFWDNVNGVDVLRSRGPIITITFNEAGQYVPSAARCVN